MHVWGVVVSESGPVDQLLPTGLDGSVFEKWGDGEVGADGFTQRSAKGKKTEHEGEARMKDREGTVVSGGTPRGGETA